MRKSFEKYLKVQSIGYKEPKKYRGIRKFILGFIAGLFFVGTFSYAAPVLNGGTIGSLFEFFDSRLENGRPQTDIYRLVGTNIKDKSITNYELSDNSVNSRVIYPNSIQTGDIGDGQVTNTKLANNSVTSDKIQNGSINSIDAAMNFTAPLARYATNSEKLNGRISTNYLDPTKNEIPTSKAVKKYVDNNLFSVQTVTCKGKIDYYRAQCEATCPSNTILIGGGCKINSGWRAIIKNYPKNSKTWECYAHEDFGSTDYEKYIYGYALCLKTQ